MLLFILANRRFAVVIAWSHIISVAYSSLSQSACLLLYAHRASQLVMQHHPHVTRSPLLLLLVAGCWRHLMCN